MPSQCSQPCLLLSPAKRCPPLFDIPTHVATHHGTVFVGPVHAVLSMRPRDSRTAYADLKIRFRTCFAGDETCYLASTCRASLECRADGPTLPACEERWMRLHPSRRENGGVPPMWGSLVCRRSGPNRRIISGGLSAPTTSTQRRVLACYTTCLKWWP